MFRLLLVLGIALFSLPLKAAILGEIPYQLGITQREAYPAHRYKITITDYWVRQNHFYALEIWLDDLRLVYQKSFANPQEAKMRKIFVMRDDLAWVLLEARSRCRKVTIDSNAFIPRNALSVSEIETDCKNH